MKVSEVPSRGVYTKFTWDMVPNLGVDVNLGSDMTKLYERQRLREIKGR